MKNRVTRYESLEQFREEVEAWEAQTHRRMATFVREFDNGEVGIICGNSAWRGIPAGDSMPRFEKWLKARGAIKSLGVADRADILN